MKRRFLPLALALLALAGVLCLSSSPLMVATPVSPGASPEARALLPYIHPMYGKKILSGQMWAPWGNDEIARVKNITGKFPALGGQGYIHERANKRENELAIGWWKARGIPTIHECGTIPDPDQSFQKGVAWSSWWMLWHTDHLSNYDKDALIRAYNYDLVITRDEMPSIMDYLNAEAGSAKPAASQ